MLNLLQKKEYNMTKLHKQIAFALFSFLAAWQATGFSLDYRAVLGAAVSAYFGFKIPKGA
jgi:hypothetical protein